MRNFRGAVVAVAVGCSCVLIPDPECRADEVTVARIAQVWGERENRVKSCRVVWSEKATYPKGSRHLDMFAAPQDLPPMDVTIPATCTMLIDGRKSRYEYRGQMWSIKTRKLELAEDIVTFDGERSGNTSLSSPLIGNPQVVLNKASASPQSGLPLFLPIWLSVRATAAASEIPIERFSPTGRKEKITNRICSEFSRTISGSVREVVFVDTERDCQITRYAYYRDEKLKIRLEISYQTDPTLGWVPGDWDLVLCNKTGAIEMSTRCVVTEFVVNAPVAPPDFEPVLPIGARVIDLTSGKEMHSAILPSGEQGKEIEYVPGRGMIPYETLMAQPPQRGWWQRTGWWVLTGVGLLLAVGLGVWWVRRGVKPKQS